MIEYEDFVAAAPTISPKEERDAWFEARNINPVALLRCGFEYGATRLADLQEGDTIGQREMTQALQIAVLFGAELAIRALEAHQA